MKKYFYICLACLLIPLNAYAWVLSGVAGGSGASEDVTAPTVIEGAGTNIDTNGTLLTVAFSESVSEGTGYDDADWTLSCSTTGPLTVAHSTGDGTSSWGLAITGGPVQDSGTDTCTLDWAGTSDGVEDGSGNDLAAIDPVKSIVNNSTQGSSTAVVRTDSGSVVTIESASQSSSQAVTVPTDAELAVIIVHAYTGSSPPSSDWANPATSLNSVNATRITGALTSIDNNQVIMEYVVIGSTGSLTFAWDLSLTGYAAGTNITIVFYKNVNTSAPITDSDFIVDADDISGLTANSGDMMVGAVGTDNVPTVDGSGQTELAQLTTSSGYTQHLGVAEKSEATGFTSSGTAYPSAVACTIAVAP